MQERGLVVISSCGHSGIINTVKTAMAVSNISKLHAVLGGFHLGTTPKDYVEHTVAELKALTPDIMIPMHCTSSAFVNAMRDQMSEQLMTSNTGSRCTFGE